MKKTVLGGKSVVFVYGLIILIGFFGKNLTQTFSILSASLFGNDIVATSFKHKTLTYQDCHTNKGSWKGVSSKCITSSATGLPPIVLLGDSHAWHFMPAFELLSNASGRGLVVSAYTSCIYYPDNALSQETDGCNKYVKDSIEIAKKYYKNGSLIFISSDWVPYLDPEGRGRSYFENSTSSNYYVELDPSLISETHSRGSVFVIGPTPRTSIETNLCLYPGFAASAVCLTPTDNAGIKARESNVFNVISDSLRSNGFERIFAIPVFNFYCLSNTENDKDFDGKGCSSLDSDGNIVFTDDNHLSIDQAKRLYYGRLVNQL